MKKLLLLLVLGSCRFECKMESRQNIPQDACGSCKPVTVGNMAVACTCKDQT